MSAAMSARLFQLRGAPPVAAAAGLPMRIRGSAALTLTASGRGRAAAQPPQLQAEGSRRSLSSAGGSATGRAPMPEIPPSLGSWESLRDRLYKVDACALCDGSGKQARVVDTVKPLRPRQGTKMVGRAHTVALFPGDFLMNLVALEAAVEGDVLMIDAGYRRGGPSPEWPVTGGMFGELLAAEAERKGLAGMVIDGNCRDTPMTATFSIPIYSRGTHPNAGTAAKLGSVGEPVQMGTDIVVNHGDVVFGDDDGVVVCSPAELESWLPAAEAIVSAESGMLRRIRQGESLINMTSYYSHVEALKAGDADSKLGFK
eukprot:SAG22_NODE_1459_length_4374_cov_14.272047_3_plen_314_part_00